MSNEEHASGHARSPATSSTGGVNIFISYRRDDAWDTPDRLREHLVERKPDCHVFLDVESIPFGEKWGDEIEDAIENCHAVLALIGKDWIVDRAGRRRLEDPEDVLRRELEAALEKRLPIIPVLIHEAQTPSPSDVPDSLRPLLDFQGINMYREYWQPAINALVGRLDQIGRRRTYTADPQPPQPSTTGESKTGETDSQRRRTDTRVDSQRGITSNADEVETPRAVGSEVTGKLPADYVLATRVVENGGALDIAVRELVALFGRRRLTDAAIGELEGTLDLAGLHTQPKIARLSLGGTVRITQERDVPEFRLRARIDAEEIVSVSVAELLQQFRRRRLTDKVRAEIDECLRYVGLLTEPPISKVNKDDTVTVRAAGKGSTPVSPTGEPDGPATSAPEAASVAANPNPDPAVRVARGAVEVAQPVSGGDTGATVDLPSDYVLAQRVMRQGGSVNMTVRELLALFGRQRLTDAAIAELEGTLGMAGLRCQPKIERLTIDETVEITQDREVPEFWVVGQFETGVVSSSPAISRSVQT